MGLGNFSSPLKTRFSDSVTEVLWISIYYLVSYHIIKYLGDYNGKKMKKLCQIRKKTQQNENYEHWREQYAYNYSNRRK